MHNILLCLGYDGTDFNGYQRQSGGRTVQGVLEDTLHILYNNEVIETIAAGRTDSGVHAERQYVNIQMSHTHIPIEKISFALNSLLPDDVYIYWTMEVPMSFHARYSAIERIYYYQLIDKTFALPTLKKYAMSIAEDLDWEKIEDDLVQFVGVHDFSAFASYNPQIENYVRTITDIRVDYHKEITKIYISGNAFLWKMVRTIIGTVLERAIKRTQGKSSLMSIHDILTSRDRNNAGATAAPHGLFLYEVRYKEEYGIKGRV